MLREADAVVIGAGATGASTAYHLANLGKKVVLVDKHEPVTQTSPRAAGLAMQIQADDALARVGLRSIQKMVRFEEETGQPLDVHQWGSIKVARTESDERQLHDEVRRGRALGVEVGLISDQEARRLAPWLNPQETRAMWYAPLDLFLQPGDLPRAYVRAAGELGADICGRTKVTGIGTRDGMVDTVATDKGTIQTPTVVDAAGAWTRLVGELTGIRIPLWPTRHQLCVTEPLAEVGPGQPTVRVMDAKTYARPERGGLLFGAYEPDPLQVDPREQPPDFRIEDLALDFTPLRRKMAEVRDQFPLLQSVGIDELRGGLPTMTPDGHFIVDRVAELEGFWVASGCNVGGLSNSPALGEDLASWIAGGERSADLEPFRLDRFGPEYEDEARLREACFATYAHKYSDEEVEAH